MAEWLGRGLQNLVQRFESASDLQILQSRRLAKSSVFLWLWLSASPRHCRKTSVAYWLLLCTVIAIAHLLTRVAGIIVYILLALAVLRFAVSPRAAGCTLASNPLQTSKLLQSRRLAKSSVFFCIAISRKLHTTTKKATAIDSCRVQILDWRLLILMENTINLLLYLLIYLLLRLLLRLLGNSI